MQFYVNLGFNTEVVLNDENLSEHYNNSIILNISIGNENAGC